MNHVLNVTKDGDSMTCLSPISSVPSSSLCSFQHPSTTEASLIVFLTLQWICSCMSQNPSMAELGSDVWRPPCPQLKHSHLELVAQGCVQMTFECLQEWRPHNFSEKPMLVLRHPFSEKNDSLCSKGPSCFSVGVHCLLCCHWVPLERAWPCSLCTFPSGFCAHWQNSPYTWVTCIL